MLQAFFVHYFKCSSRCRFLLLLLLLPFSGYAQEPAPARGTTNPADSVGIDSLRKALLPPPFYARDRFGDPLSNFYTRSPLYLRNTKTLFPLNISLDSTGNYYQLAEPVDTTNSFYFRPVTRIPYQDYRDYRYQQDTRKYWRNLSLAQDGETELAGDGQNLLPPIQLGPLANRLFGGSQLDVVTNGNLVVDFGGLWTRVSNPQLPVNQQRVGGFNFDQQIDFSLQAQIGEKLKADINVDTQNAFQFEQRYNLAYTAYEEDIIQDVQVGNVSFPVANSLITGSQNLFGVYTRMRFGKLFISGIISSKRSTAEEITVRNGAQQRPFEIRAHDYDLNRHFFLSDFFRSQYEQALRQLPQVQSQFRVTRVQVYVTNRNNSTQTLRSVLATTDLGDADPFRNLPITVPVAGAGPASNNANRLYQNLTGLTRDPEQIRVQLEQRGLENGADFELLKAARQLTEAEFELNDQLGFISLNYPLRNDEVLAVAFEYSFNGQSYKVGELQEDFAELESEEVIFLKLLSPSTIRTDLPTWDLMMKNIYSLQATQIERLNFQLRVIYRDDLTGIDNPSLHEGARITNVPLLQVMGLDRLNPNLDPQPDGNFDFLIGKTIFPGKRPNYVPGAGAFWR